TTLVIPIFLPMIPFIFLKFYAIGYEISYRHTVGNTASIYFFNPSFAADLFFASPFARLVRVPRSRSTGSKQTLNGLFICFAFRPLGPRSGFLTNFCVAPPEVYSFGQNLSSAILSLSEVYRWNLKELLPHRGTSQPLSGFDLHIHPRRQIQFGQSVNRAGRRRVDVQEALVRMQLELLTGLLIDVRRTQNRKDLLTRGQRNRTCYHGTGATNGLDDLLGGFVHQIVIV